MAVHLVLIACLAAPPNTCQEIPLPEVTSADVVSCNGTARAKSEEWQSQHKDYLVIATKCAKAGEGEAAPASPPPPPAKSE
jgi:hypothetical protein